MKKSIIICALLIISLSSCNFIENPQSSDSSEPDVVTSATMSRYRPDELHEYNGTPLDPSVGPRDNSIKGIQTVSLSGYTLKIDGLVNSPQDLTYDEVLALPSDTRLLTLHCVERWSATLLWKGVPLKDLFQASQVKAEAKTVIFHAVDGYTTSIPLAEVLSKNLMMAYGANGLAIPPQLGFPFIFVAEDKWGYKWARWINRIELSADTNYEGYWEALGYDNAGDYK